MPFISQQNNSLNRQKTNTSIVGDSMHRRKGDLRKGKQRIAMLKNILGVDRFHYFRYENCRKCSPMMGWGSNRWEDIRPQIMKDILKREDEQERKTA
jgi:hypothetical protein